MSRPAVSSSNCFRLQFWRIRRWNMLLLLCLGVCGLLGQVSGVESKNVSVLFVENLSSLHTFKTTLPTRFHGNTDCMCLHLCEQKIENATDCCTHTQSTLLIRGKCTGSQIKHQWISSSSSAQYDNTYTALWNALQLQKTHPNADMLQCAQTQQKSATSTQQKCF